MNYWFGLVEKGIREHEGSRSGSESSGSGSESSRSGSEESQSGDEGSRSGSEGSEPGSEESGSGSDGDTSTYWLDGSQGTFRYWAEGYPQHENAFCVLYTIDGWKDMSCGSEFHYICKSSGKRTNFSRNDIV